MESQIVLVTGAKGGLGSFVTEAFLQAGATVLGVARSIDASAFRHPSFAALPADLTNAESTGAMVQEAMARFGRIDALAHIAGGFAGGTPVAETTDATWDHMMNLNLRAAFNVLRAVVPRMREAGRGRIVAIGSRAAAEPAPGIGAYSASKAALVSLIRTVALENKDRGITANVILPGTMDTAGNRPDWVQPARVAALVAFLVSDAAAQINSAAIPVYGAEA